MRADETAAFSSTALHNETTTATIAAACKRQPPNNKNSNQRSTPPHQRKTQPNVSKTCLGCGKTGHTFKSTDCPATGKTCRHCGNLNHFATVCLRKANGKKSIHRVQLGTVSSPARSLTPEILVELSVSHGQSTTTLTSMVDTGADISAIQKSVFQRHFAQCATQPVSTTVRNFDGSTVNDLHGMFTAMVSHGGRQTDANLYIVANNLPSVAGRDLIQALGLRINGESLTVRVCVAENNQTSNNILSNFPSLLDDSLGTYPGHKHVISLSNDFQPHATKVRPVPLTKRDAVMAEIKSMVDNGIWSPVDKSECAHAMVTVGKKDGGVRITSDLSPLNKYVIPDRHPLPRIEDLFLKLRGCHTTRKSTCEKDIIISNWTTKASASQQP